MPTKKSTAKTATKTKKVVAKKTANKVNARKGREGALGQKTAKKTTKKSTQSTASKKPLQYAADDTSFWSSDGHVLNSLVALRDALEEMENSIYTFHAGGDENDFANWVEVVLCDAECAKDLRKAKTKNGAKTVVVKHLKYYEF